MGDDFKVQAEKVWAGQAGAAFLSLRAQRIGAGHALVLSKRSYDPGSRFAIDDESYEMMSIMVPDLMENQTLDVEKGDILAVFSWGSSAFPEYGCFGYASSGNVSVEPKERGRVRVELTLRITSRPSDDFESSECADREVSDAGVYEVKTLSELTPWLGAPARHPYEASYR